MAHSLSSLPHELCCSICTEIFKEPLILKCSHTFCRSCLQKCWKNKIFQCPICRKKCSEDEPVLNRSLKEVADLFQKNNQSEIQNEPHCSLHGEKILLFCEDDQEVLCVVCQTSKKHRNHRLCPIEEALQDKKEELKTALKPMKENVEKLTRAEEEYEKTIVQIKIQAQNTERQIKEEYERIFQFLRDEEKDRLTALKKEEENNTKRMKEKKDNISKSISNLSDRIKSTERGMNGDDITFLKTYKDMKQRLIIKLQDSERLSGDPIDVTKHLEPLKLRMMEIRGQSSTPKPAPVKVHVVVKGPILNSHQTFMRKLDMPLEECSLEKCSVILVFCLIITRMGANIDAVMRNIPDGKAAVLVLMLHSSTPEHVFELPAPATKSNVVKVVQCVFHESAGLLECELNRRAVRAVRSELEFYQ